MSPEIRLDDDYVALSVCMCFDWFFLFIKNFTNDLYAYTINTLKSETMPFFK